MPDVYIVRCRDLPIEPRPKQSMTKELLFFFSMVFPMLLAPCCLAQEESPRNKAGSSEVGSALTGLKAVQERKWRELFNVPEERKKEAVDAVVEIEKVKLSNLKKDAPCQDEDFRWDVTYDNGFFWGMCNAFGIDSCWAPDCPEPEDRVLNVALRCSNALIGCWDVYPDQTISVALEPETACPVIDQRPKRSVSPTITSTRFVPAVKKEVVPQVDMKTHAIEQVRRQRKRDVRELKKSINGASGEDFRFDAEVTQVHSTYRPTYDTAEVRLLYRDTPLYCWYLFGRNAFVRGMRCLEK